MENGNALAVMEEERSIESVKGQVEKIQELMKAVMHDGEHYGVIPGTNGKKSLLKPGAEKLCFVFRLAPEFEIERDDLPNGHREYRVKTVLRNMSTGNLVGQGLGSCSTMEKKYRYRNGSDYKITGEPIPKDAKEKKAEYRRDGYGMKQINGACEWVKYNDTGVVENPDIADMYNTVLKMAKKRSLVDATITACAASDIFSQDIEDEDIEDEPRNVSPKAYKAAAEYKAELATLMQSPDLYEAGKVAISEALAKDTPVEKLAEFVERAEQRIAEAQRKGKK
jgi:hypothetical protein